MTRLLDATLRTNIAGIAQTHPLLTGRLSKEVQEQAKAKIRNEIIPKFINTVAPINPPQSAGFGIQWKSRKQQQAYFASKGFGRGIPTQRTGGLRYGWHYETRSSETSISVKIYNTAQSQEWRGGINVGLIFNEQFVTGIYQQPFHKFTGWPRSDKVQDKTQWQIVQAVRSVMGA